MKNEVNANGTTKNCALAVVTKCIESLGGHWLETAEEENV